MEELYINNIQAELNPRSIARTLQVNDLAEVQDRQANYSNTIKLPRTTKNIQLMEHLGIAGATTRLPYENVSVKYVVNGIELVSNGKGVIKQSNSFFDLVIYDGNISMKDLLSNEQMNELDFTALNHNLTEASFTGSFSNTTGYVYGLARYFDDVNTNVFPIEFMSPCIYTHTLFEMIFAQKGYTISGSCLTDPNFLSRVTTMTRGHDRNISESKTQVFQRDNSSDPTIISNSLAPNIAKEFVIDSYIVTTTINHTISLVGELTIVKGSEPRILLKTNGSTAATVVIDGAFDTEVNLQLEVGDILDIIVSIAGDDATDIEFSTEYNTIISENLMSIPIDFSTLIGDTLKIDFIKDVMQHYGMVFRKVPNSLEFEFKCMKEILIDKSGAEDWSNKYSRVLTEGYKPNYAKINYAKYLYDEADTEQTFGDGFISIDNENLKATGTLFTSVFKASQLANTVYYKAFHWVNEEDGEIISQVPNDDGLRTFQVLQSSTTIFYKYKIEGGAAAAFTGVVPILYFPTYQTVISRNYLELQEMLADYKTITLEMNLSIVDIYHLDFFKLKYFEQLGQYYYLNKVKGHKPNKVVKVELIQIGDDVVPKNEIEGGYAGSSTYTATISNLEQGEIQGGYAGSSFYGATIRYAEPTSFELSSSGTTEGSVCGSTSMAERWHDGLGVFPAVNDTIFTDSLGTTPLNGNNLFYKLSYAAYVRVNSSGLVTQKSNC